MSFEHLGPFFTLLYKITNNALNIEKQGLESVYTEL